MQVSINRCINKENRIMGWNMTGFTSFILTLMLGGLFINLWVGVMMSFPAYFIARQISRNLLKGTIQKWLYYYVPNISIWNRDNLPASYKRYFLR